MERSISGIGPIWIRIGFMLIPRGSAQTNCTFDARAHAHLGSKTVQTEVQYFVKLRVVSANAQTSFSFRAAQHYHSTSLETETPVREGLSSTFRARTMDRLAHLFLDLLRLD